MRFIYFSIFCTHQVRAEEWYSAHPQHARTFGFIYPASSHPLHVFQQVTGIARSVQGHNTASTVIASPGSQAKQWWYVQLEKNAVSMRSITWIVLA